MNRDELIDQLIIDEGEVLHLYKDKANPPKWTIGVGHNIEDKGISKAVSRTILAEDISEHLALLDKYCPWWRDMDEIRQQALANMAFNMGVGPTDEDPRGKLLTFKNTLHHMEAGEYEEAANGMLQSLWARQVGKRAERLSQMMRTGKVEAT